MHFYQYFKKLFKRAKWDVCLFFTFTTLCIFYFYYAFFVCFVFTGCIK